MDVGRERPLAGRAWGEEGGSQMGVAHAPLSISSAATTASTATPAAQSAAGVRVETADQQENPASIVATTGLRVVDASIESFYTQGNGAPESWFPRPVPLHES